MAFGQIERSLISVQRRFIIALDAEHFAFSAQNLAFEIEVAQLFGNGFGFVIGFQRGFILAQITVGTANAQQNFALGAQLA